jgi:effector-binding domain-containing protein
MLNVYHTYIPHKEKNNLKLKGIIWKEEMYPQLLSVLEAKKNYGNISIYTNNSTKKQLKDIGLPYDYVDTSLLNKENSHMFSYYKLKVYENIKEEFLHIDTDTILYKNFYFENSDKEFIFASPSDVGPEGLNEYDFPNLVKTYAGLFYVLEKQHSEFKKENFKVSEIPNMSVVYVKNYESMNLAAKKSIEHYQKNKKFIDGSSGECYIEQLMVHLNLMEINEDYMNQVRGKETFLSSKEFLMIEQEYQKIYNDYVYPLKLNVAIPKSYHQSKSLLLYLDWVPELTEREVILENEEDIIKLFDFDFFGVHHLSFRKWSKVLQCICIGYIHKNYGEHWIRQVHDYYKHVYPSYGLETLSEGEKLYEKLTGFKF